MSIFLSILFSFLFFGSLQPNRSISQLTPYMDSIISQAQEDQTSIEESRKEILDELISAIKQQKEVKGKAQITYICTHNSRRSQLAEILSATIAQHLAIDSIYTYSGGTEITAFNPRAVAALERVGFEFRIEENSSNPIYHLSIDKDKQSKRCFSKQYDDPFNPKSDFIAVMVCSSADRDCPIVYGADKRISLPYLDPKAFDATKIEAEKYDERLRQIAAEMYYVFSRD